MLLHFTLSPSSLPPPSTLTATSPSNNTGDFVPREYRCNGRNECGDWRDEIGCNYRCPRGWFRCHCFSGARSCDFWGCVPPILRCNGHNDCGDWSDEQNCFVECDDDDGAARLPVPVQNCNGHKDCPDWNDERRCSCTDPGTVDCACLFAPDELCKSAPSGQCVKVSLIGDNVTDCANGADESLRCRAVGDSEDSACSERLYRCEDEASVAALRIAHQRHNAIECHPVRDYRVSEDYTICIARYCASDTLCHEYTSLADRLPFRCSDGVDGGDFRSFSAFCDGRWNCPGHEDEQYRGFRCRYRGRPEARCALPQANLYDDLAQCDDGADLCFGGGGEFSCFRCFDSRLIVSAKQVCDGVPDCYDASDECLCANTTACDVATGRRHAVTVPERCSGGRVYCNAVVGCVDYVAVLCDFEVVCENRFNLRLCNQPLRTGVLWCASGGRQVTAHVCDGRPECDDMSDECGPECGPRRPSYCKCRACAPIYCNGRYSDALMDGTACPDTELPEDCPARFYCESLAGLVSIDVDHVCDGVRDCVDDHDESLEVCGHGRLFYCASSGEAVRADYYGDGVVDCADGSDEPTKLFASKRQLIGSAPLRAAFAIMATLALVGNAAVVVKSGRYLAERRRHVNKVRTGQQVMILNLALSDLLMGVYLLGITVKAAEVTGVYAQHDLRWRSGRWCSALGCCAWLSSQASVLNMALLTWHRLVGIYAPYASERVAVRHVVASCVLVWILSLAITLAPLADSATEYFTAALHYPNHFSRSHEVSAASFCALANRAAYLGGLAAPAGLHASMRVLAKMLPDHEVLGTVGYYGKTSVCLPRLFVARGDAGWEFTLFLITFNVLLFCSIAAGYLLIFLKVSLPPGAIEKDIKVVAHTSVPTRVEFSKQPRTLLKIT